MNSYDGYSDTHIKGMIESQERSIQSHQQSIDISNGFIKEAQAELDRRALEAYWTQHPELTRVRVDDMLITLEKYADETWPAGTITKVERIDIVNNTCTSSSDPFTWRTGYLHEACEERRAYLEQQGGEG